MESTWRNAEDRLVSTDSRPEARVATWHDSELHYLVAGTELSAMELTRIAESMYIAGS